MMMKAVVTAARTGPATTTTGALCECYDKEHGLAVKAQGSTEPYI